MWYYSLYTGMPDYVVLQPVYWIPDYVVLQPVHWVPDYVVLQPVHWDALLCGITACTLGCLTMWYYSLYTGMPDYVVLQPVHWDA